MRNSLSLLLMILFAFRLQAQPAPPVQPKTAPPVQPKTAPPVQSRAAPPVQAKTPPSLPVKAAAAVEPKAALSEAKATPVGERDVNLSWEEAADAKSYDLEIGERGTKRAIKSFTNIHSGHWSGTLKPGDYWMRVRGNDDRGVPGEWSDDVAFKVKLPAAKTIAPAQSSTLLASTEAPVKLRLIWDSVVGAVAYQLVVKDEAQKIIDNRKVIGTHNEILLNPAMSYTWSVQAIDASGVFGDAATVESTFSVQGPPLAAPRLAMPESIFVREVRFARPPLSQMITLSFHRLDKDTNQWFFVALKESPQGNRVKFENDRVWPGGLYQVTAVAFGKNRQPSKQAVIRFNVTEGSRSVYAENMAMLRQSIERSKDWFLSSNYILSQANFHSQIVEDNKSYQTSAVTSALQIGLGRFFDSPAGFLGNITMAGFRAGGDVTSSVGIELLGLYRFPIGKGGELRIKAGGAYRQFPEIVSGIDVIQVKNLTAVGPLLGFEYWHAFSPKWAAQINASGMAVSGGKSARGYPLLPSVHSAAGILVGKKMQGHSAILAGYTYRTESFKFKGTNEGLGLIDGYTNSQDMKGHFLEMIFEYDF